MWLDANDTMHTRGEPRTTRLARSQSQRAAVTLLGNVVKPPPSRAPRRNSSPPPLPRPPCFARPWRCAHHEEHAPRNDRIRPSSGRVRRHPPASPPSRRHRRIHPRSPVDPRPRRPWAGRLGQPALRGDRGQPGTGEPGASEAGAVGRRCSPAYRENARDLEWNSVPLRRRRRGRRLRREGGPGSGACRAQDPRPRHARRDQERRARGWWGGCRGSGASRGGPVG